MVLTSLNVAPQAGTANGNRGVQALLTTNQTFNTSATFTNQGPGTAPSLKAQITFDQVPNPNEFAVTAPWVVDSVTENTTLGRWVVNLTYNASVASRGTVSLVITTRTRLASAFPTGQSGAYEVLGRAYNSDGSLNNDLSDYFYVIR